MQDYFLTLEFNMGVAICTASLGDLTPPEAEVIMGLCYESPPSRDLPLQWNVYSLGDAAPVEKGATYETRLSYIEAIDRRNKGLTNEVRWRDRGGNEVVFDYNALLPFMERAVQIADRIRADAGRTTPITRDATMPVKTKWVSLDEAAAFFKVTKATLGKYRSGNKNAKDGIDSKGNEWRLSGDKQNSPVEYRIPDLD